VILACLEINITSNNINWATLIIGIKAASDHHEKILVSTDILDLNSGLALKLVKRIRSLDPQIEKTSAFI
jgi:ketopantoate hydroxymethyltransferase